MIKEAYCSFEVAKLLKEKRFDEDCVGRYSVRTQEFHLDQTRKCNNGGLFEIAAPTHQMAMAWLREKGIYVVIYPNQFLNEPLLFNIQIFGSNAQEIHNEYDFNTYKEAVEAALKYSLENLI